MTAPTRLRDRVLQAIREQALWTPGQTVAVAVSGGLDSMALLHLLHRLQGAHGGRLSVVTVDHGTRPDSADHARFVAQQSHDLGLACQVATVALGPGASEDRCRQARYAAFDALDVDRVALAHHRDDQAETVLLRWVRGAGTRGLSGMAPRRGRYVRPLLRLARAELEAYAAAVGLEWREDETNAEPRYLRNRVRRELLPLLEDLRPGATATLARTARLAAEDDALLVSLATTACPQQGQTWRTADLVRAAPPLARRALLLALPGANSSHIDAILAACRSGAGAVALSDRLQVRIDRDLVSILCEP